MTIRPAKTAQRAVRVLPPISGDPGTLGRCRVAENHPKTGLPEYPTKGCTLPPCYLKMTALSKQP